MQHEKPQHSPYCPTCRKFLGDDETQVENANVNGEDIGVVCCDRCGATVVYRARPVQYDRHLDTMLTPFRFENVELVESCLVDGSPHFTRRAIGEGLGYADPQKAIDNLLERHPQIRRNSVPLKLTATDGKSYTTEVFSPIGLFWIAMKAQTKRADAFQEWAAHLIDAWRTGRLVNQAAPRHFWPPTDYDITRDPRVAFRKRLIHQLYNTAIGERGQVIRYFALKHGVNERTIRRWQSRYFAMGDEGLIDRRLGNQNSRKYPKPAPPLADPALLDRIDRLERMVERLLNALAPEAN